MFVTFKMPVIWPRCSKTFCALADSVDEVIYFFKCLTDLFLKKRQKKTMSRQICFSYVKCKKDWCSSKLVESNGEHLVKTANITSKGTNKQANKT